MEDAHPVLGGARLPRLVTGMTIVACPNFLVAVNSCLFSI
jgi:hypothetical protein